MGWLIALAILLLPFLLPLGASVKYDSGGVNVRVIAGPVKFQIFPQKKKEKKEKKPKAAPEKAKKKAERAGAPVPDPLPEPVKPVEKSKGGPITDFIPLLRTALDMLADFPRVFRVERLEAKVVLAGDDPCDLATNYGRIWAAVGNLWPKLEEMLIIKKRDINVECDFTADETLITARLDLTLTLGRILVLAVPYGLKALKQYFDIMKSRKGGATI